MDLFELFLVIGSVVAFLMTILQVSFIFMAVKPIPFDMHILLSVGVVVTFISSIIFGMYGFRIVIPEQQEQSP